MHAGALDITDTVIAVVTRRIGQHADPLEIAGPLAEHLDGVGVVPGVIAQDADPSAVAGPQTGAHTLRLTETRIASKGVIRPAGTIPVVAAKLPQQRRSADLAERLAALVYLEAVVSRSIDQNGNSLRRCSLGERSCGIPVIARPVELQRHAASDRHWHVFNMALSDFDGTASFNIMAADQFSSLKAPSGEQDAIFADRNKVTKTVEMQCRRLDSVLPDLKAQHGFTRPFLKMDTQGHDLSVCEGAGDALAQMLGIQTELGVRPTVTASEFYRTSTPTP